MPLRAAAAFALAELAERAGVPRGVLNVLCGDAKAIGEAMLKSEEVCVGWWGGGGGLGWVCGVGEAGGVAGDVVGCG